MKKQPTLWDADRLTLDDAMALTLASLQTYLPRYPDVAIAYSGGKDSSAVVTFVAHAIAHGLIPAPRSLYVVYADTGLELPPLHHSALQVLARLHTQGVDTQVVHPAMDKRFFVMMFGRGVPPPHNGLRWCTGALKIDPMEGVFAARAAALGIPKLLLLTGVRVGESAARDQRIALSCSKNGSECGQGWFKDEAPAYATLAPLLHWRVCHVWDWLSLFAPDAGWPTAVLASVYGGDEKEEINARTGCVQCNVAHKDTALAAVLRLPEWAYLAPLTELLPLYAELSAPHMRLRREARFLGPLTMDARAYGQARVLDIQARINAVASRAGRPGVSLISQDELVRIEALRAANTWPQHWTGAEPRGDSAVAWRNKNGSAQPWLLTEVNG